MVQGTSDAIRLSQGEESRAIKQDQYTVIEYTQCEAAAITHKLRKGDNEMCRNTRLSATVSSTCWLPLTLKSSRKDSLIRG